MKSQLKAIPETCKEFSDPVFLLSFIYADISNENYFIKFNTCEKQDKKDVAMLRHENANFYLTKDEYQIVKKIHSLMEKENLETLGVTIVDIHKAFKSKNKTYHLKQILKKLQTTHYSRYNQLLKVYLYAKLDNRGAFEREIITLLDMPKYSKALILKTESMEKYFSLLEKISEIENENKLYNLYLLSEINSSDDEFKSMLEDFMSISPADFYKNLLSPTFALIYPKSWTRWAYTNLNIKKYSRIYKKINFNSLSEGQLSSLHYYRKLDDGSLKSIEKRLRKISESNKFEIREMFFKIIKNKQLRNDLKLNNIIELSSFGRRRNFYQSSLKAFNSIEYNVFNLFSLGDINREYFIYSLAVRTYGLPSTKLLQIK